MLSSMRLSPPAKNKAFFKSRRTLVCGFFIDTRFGVWYNIRNILNSGSRSRTDKTMKGIQASFRQAYESQTEEIYAKLQRKNKA